LVPLYFVTGISGSGKSTVRNYLKMQGYEAYATDEDGLAAWYDKVTGEEYPGYPSSDERTPEFSQRFAWMMSRAGVAQLATDAAERPVYLCGAVANELELLDLFAVVITLDVDVETLRRRLASRTNNDFGKSAHELAQIISWHADDFAAYRRTGHIIVDAARPIDEVVRDVLAHTVGDQGGMRQAWSNHQ
jgi:dephospho-CoA kinase